jgi:hypothetical protein
VAEGSEFAVQIEGVRELSRALGKADADLKTELRLIHKDVAGVVSDEARNLVPVRSGALRDSIRPLGTQRVGRVAAGKARVPYAGPIHFGWPARNISPQPFLVDALQHESTTISVVYEREIRQFIDRVWALYPTH